MSKSLQNTAELVVHLGWGGEQGVKGKLINISTAPSNYDLACVIAEKAYSLGARQCHVNAMTPEIIAMHLRAHGDDPDIRNEVLSPFADSWNMLVANQGCTVRIESPEDPLALSSVDQQHASERTAAEYRARQLFYDQGLFGRQLPWTIIPRATVGWGKVVCPEASDPRQALQDLLDTILEVNEDDCLERWTRRAERMQLRSDRLNALKAVSLRFRGEGTDLTVGLSHLARFSGALKTTKFGVRHLANIPTHENFTTPDYRQTRGVVRMTRPVLIGGSLVEGLEVHFNDTGEVEHFTAEKGKEAFAAMLNSPGANRLGEVALVGIDDSSIFATGMLFSNTLLDENAACHIAFGRAYSSQLEGGTEMSKEEQAAIGCNHSEKHHDMMISDDHTSVLAILPSGEEVVIIENGAWAGEFAAAA